MVGEGKVEGLVTYSNSYSRLDFLLDVVGIRGAGNDGEALLHVPADDDLSGTLAVGLGNVADHRVAQQFALRVASAQGEPALYLDVVLPLTATCHLL